MIPCVVFLDNLSRVFNDKKYEPMFSTIGSVAVARLNVVLIINVPFSSVRQNTSPVLKLRQRSTVLNFDAEVSGVLLCALLPFMLIICVDGGKGDNEDKAKYFSHPHDLTLSL